MRDRPTSAQTASIPIPNSSRQSHTSLATQTGLRLKRNMNLRTCYNELSVNRPQFGCQTQGCDFRTDSVVTLRKHQKVHREPWFTSLIIITRPKPPYGRQGLAGLWGQDTDQAGTFWGQHLTLRLQRSARMKTSLVRKKTT